MEESKQARKQWLTNYTEKQVSIVASYIKERTKNAQFIVISLRNNMVRKHPKFTILESTAKRLNANTDLK